MGSQEHIEMICHKTTGNKSLKKFFLRNSPWQFVGMEYARNEKENRHVETIDEIPYKPIFQSQVIDNHQKHNKTLAKSSHSILFLVIFFY